MKKIFLITCVLCLYFTVVNADSIEVVKAWDAIERTGIVEKTSFEGQETINRYDCVSMVMRAIGAGDELDKEAYGVSVPVFCDGDEIDSVDADEWMQKFSDECIFDMHITNYPELAVTDAKIAIGEFIDSRGAVYFNFFKEATVKECSAFLVRCLTGKKTNLDMAFSEAEEVGLVSKEDDFYYYADKSIHPDDFAIMLYRFLQMPRKLYFSGDQHSTNRIKFSVDEKGEMTYLDFLIDEGMHIHFVNDENDAIEVADKVFAEKLGQDFVKNTKVHVAWGYGTFRVYRFYEKNGFYTEVSVEVDRHTGKTKWMD